MNERAAGPATEPRLVLLDAGTRLKKWRDDNGVSQAVAAARIQSTQGAWTSWERGVRAPDLIFAFAIEKLTGGVVKAESWAVGRPTSRIARGLGAEDADAPDDLTRTG